MKKTAMTRYEKISMYLSIVALLLSLGSPILMYYWLDPTLKAFSLRGRLQVSSSPEYADLHRKAIEALLTGSELPEIVFDVEVLNIGELPASGIQIITQYNLSGVKEGGVTFDPPVLYEVSYHGTERFITLKRSLAPKDKLKIFFTDYPNRVVISNEFGESSILDTGLGTLGLMKMSKENLRELEKDRRKGQ